MVRNRKADDRPEERGAIPMLISIGALSRASGIPVETLRTWERRYGFPAPVEREGSAHRRYPPTAIPRLRLVKDLLALGHKPSVVLAAEPRELEALLSLQAGSGPASLESAAGPPVPPRRVGSFDIEEWLVPVLDMDDARLDRRLHGAWDQLGALRFLTECAGPLVLETGERWHRGQLAVRHEHFLSERLRDFLASKWQTLSRDAKGSPFVCATLPGEHHVLGAHMAAVVLSLASHKVIFLGANAPTTEIAETARKKEAQAIAISISAAATPELARASLEALRRAVPSSIAIIVGGAGAVEVPGVTLMTDLEELWDWIAGR